MHVTIKTKDTPRKTTVEENIRLVIIDLNGTRFRINTDNQGNLTINKHCLETGEDAISIKPVCSNGIKLY